MNKSFLLLFLIIAQLYGAQKSIRTNFTASAPLIDGHISPLEWNVSDSATHFIQLEPAKGMPASESTVVYILHNEQYIFFAFKCFDRYPGTIVSNIRQRDKILKSDDAVAVILDTHFDQRSGFFFEVNPVGTQSDLRIADDGRQSDINWDTQWLAAARRTAWGGSAEIAIPFSGISFDENLETWGINLGRIIRHNSETAYWSGEMNDDFRISQGGLLTGLQFKKRESEFTITPYTTLRYEDSDHTGNHNRWIYDIGGDISYHLTSSLIANLTVNPDFATVEGDQEEINLTRWELSFPEKRLFFLEGNELYSTRIKTFYSRRVGDIDYGGKFVGKMGAYTISTLGVKTKEDPSTNNPSAVYSTLRLKRDILESSTIGLTLINKDWNGKYTRSLGIDYVLNLGHAWKLTGQFVASTPGDFWKSSAYFVRFSRESNIYHYHIRYSDTGENFQENVNQTGFIRDDDMREIDSDLMYTFWLDHSLIKYINLESKNNIFWNHKGTRRSWYLKDEMRIYLQNRLSLEVGYNNEFKRYEKQYYNHVYNIELGYNTDEWSSAAAEIIWGKNYDRDFRLIEGNLTTRLFDNLAIRYEFNKLDYEPDPKDNSTMINILTLDYNFSRDLWIRVLAQNNIGEDALYFYGLFGWRFQPPFGALYLIYTADQTENIDPYALEKNKIFFLKFSYQF